MTNKVLILGIGCPLFQMIQSSHLYLIDFIEYLHYSFHSFTAYW